MLHLFFLINNLFMILEKNHLLEESFEYKLFNPFDSQQIMDDEGNDLNLIFFNDYSGAVRSPYCTIDEFSCAFNSLLKNSFSILQINIKSMNKSFEILQEYVNVVKGKFRIIALTIARTIKQRKTLYGKYQITHLFTKLDKLNKNEGLLLYSCTITLILR